MLVPATASRPKEDIASRPWRHTLAFLRALLRFGAWRVALEAGPGSGREERLCLGHLPLENQMGLASSGRGLGEVPEAQWPSMGYWK